MDADSVRPAGGPRLRPHARSPRSAGTGTAGGILMGWLTAAGGTELGFGVAGFAGLAVSALVWLRSRTVPLVEEQPA